MPYVNGQWVANSQADAQRPSDVDNVLAGIPLIGGWSGAQGRQQSYNDARAADANRGYWDSLQGPTAGQLDSQQGRDAESQALGNLSRYTSGDLTSADRSQLEASRSRDAQASRAQRGALQQQSQARGVGGSGLDFAMQQQANQAGQQQSSDAESQALAMAQQRGLAATGQQAALGSRMRDEQLHGPLQQSYENQLSRAAGATGQYGTDTGNAQSRRDRQQHSDDSLLGFLGSL